MSECVVCSHPLGNQIDGDLLSLATPATVCERFGLGAVGMGVIEHVNDHWHPLLAEMMQQTWSGLTHFSSDDFMFIARLFAEVPRDRVRMRQYRRPDVPGVSRFAGTTTFEAEQPPTREELDLLLSLTETGRATLKAAGRAIPTGQAAFGAQQRLDARREHERQRQAAHKARQQHDRDEYRAWLAAGQPPMSDERRRQLGLPPRKP